MARLIRSTSPTGRRRLDSRLVIGTLVIVASVSAAYFVVSSADRTSNLYVTTTTVFAGTALTENNVALVPANLASVSDSYVAEGELVPGSIATRTIGPGEFIAHGAVGQSALVTSTRLVVDVNSGIPADTPPGTAVDVWATQVDPYGNEPSSSSIVVPGATFVREVESTTLASETSLRAELLIPRSALRSLLAAQGDGARIVVVPTVSQAG